MTNYFDIPKLNLSKKQREQLVQLYHDNKHLLKANNHSGLNFLIIDTNDTVLQDLVNIINPEYFERIYFYSSWESVEPHVDKRRATIISIPLINDGTPASFKNQDVYYSGAVLFNTQKEHWVTNSNKSFRLFVQIELSHNLDINTCIDLYQKGDLLYENNSGDS